jgi:hypothetical protein
MTADTPFRLCLHSRAFLGSRADPSDLPAPGLAALAVIERLLHLAVGRRC